MRVLELDALNGIPVVIDASGAHRLLPSYEGRMRVSSGAIVVYTDELGLRVDSRMRMAADRQVGVLVVGDDGTGLHLPYEQTAAALLGRRLGEASRTAVLAAKPQDPESIASWVRDYEALQPHRHRLIVVALSVADNLDDMYFGRSVRWVPTPPHTVAQARASAFVRLVAPIKTTRSPPPDTHASAGLTLSMLLLDAEERSILIDASVESVDRLLHMLPPSESVLVALLPSDTMVSMAYFARQRPRYASDDAYRRALAAQERAIGEWHLLWRFPLRRRA